MLIHRVWPEINCTFCVVPEIDIEWRGFIRKVLKTGCISESGDFKNVMNNKCFNLFSFDTYEHNVYINEFRFFEFQFNPFNNLPQCCRTRKNSVCKIARFTDASCVLHNYCMHKVKDIGNSPRLKQRKARRCIKAWFSWQALENFPFLITDLCTVKVIRPVKVKF
jgi:hypothetical protein